MLNLDETWSAIGEAMGEAAATLFVRDAFVVRLKQEIVKVRPTILAEQKTHRGQLGNALGIFTPTKKENGFKKSPAALLSHVLQGYEALCLQTVVRQYGSNILLCMHDGWISRVPLDTAVLENELFKATGLILSIESAVIGEDKIHSPILSKPQEFNINQYVTELSKSFSASNTLSPVGGLVVSLVPSWNRIVGISGPR